MFIKIAGTYDRVSLQRSPIYDDDDTYYTTMTAA